MGRVLIALLILMFPAVAVSCDYPTKQVKTENISVETNGISVASPSAFSFDLQEGVYSFSVAPSAKHTDSGYSYWTETGKNEGSDFEKISFKVKKTAGSEKSAFGIIFAKEKMKDNVVFDMVLINTQGQYLVCCVSGSEVSYYKEIKESSELLKGFDKENKIGISYNKTKKEFVISFNGKNVVAYKHDIEDFTGYGYGIVSVTASDSAQSEEVFFEQI